jgi:hypothetical protein
MNKVKVVKKQAYPIPTVVKTTESGASISCQILKLTEHGFLLNVSQNHFFKVGDNHFVEFEVPSTRVRVNAPIKVMKTYDIFTEPEAGSKLKVYTVEMHFRTLDPKQLQAIQFFINKIGQT